MAHPSKPPPWCFACAEAHVAGLACAETIERRLSLVRCGESEHAYDRDCTGAGCQSVRAAERARAR